MAKCKKKYNLRLTGFVGSWDFDADKVDAVLEQNAGAPVEILIDSTGGYTASALSIADAFRTHGNVSVHFRGLCASAATVAAMGAKSISMARSGLIMIHKASMPIDVYTSLNENEISAFIASLEKSKQELAKLDMAVAVLYAQHSGRKAAEMLAMMEKTTWLNAEEAKAVGLIDEITDYDDEPSQPVSLCMRDTLADAGLPIPMMPEDSKKPGFLSALFNRGNYKSSFHNNMEKIERERNLAALEAAIGVGARSDADGCISLTEDQVTRLDKALSDRDNKISDIETKLSEAESKISQLSKEPAADDSSVIDTGSSRSGDPIADYVSSLDEARNLFNSLP